MNAFVEFISNNFSSCVWLAVIIVAMMPTLESKIAIPLGMNVAMWGGNAISPLSAFLFAFVGSIIPSYAILFTARTLKKHTSVLLQSNLIRKYAIKSVRLNQKSNFSKYLAVTGFVAVPLPLTGVWSGSLICGFSELNIHLAFLSITIGALISCGIITLLCCIFNNSIGYILIFSLIIIIAFMFVQILYNTTRTKKSGI